MKSNFHCLFQKEVRQTMEVSHSSLKLIYMWNRANSYPIPSHSAEIASPMKRDVKTKIIIITGTVT